METPVTTGTASASTWASALIHAAATGRIEWSILWDILLGYADAPVPPDVGALLEHVRERHALPSRSTDLALTLVGEGSSLRGEEDWFVIGEGQHLHAAPA